MGRQKNSGYDASVGALRRFRNTAMENADLQLNTYRDANQKVMDFLNQSQESTNQALGQSVDNLNVQGGNQLAALAAQQGTEGAVGGLLRLLTPAITGINQQRLQSDAGYSQMRGNAINDFARAMADVRNQQNQNLLGYAQGRAGLVGKKYDPNSGVGGLVGQLVGNAAGAYLGTKLG